MCKKYNDSAIYLEEKEATIQKLKSEMSKMQNTSKLFKENKVENEEPAKTSNNNVTVMGQFVTSDEFKKLRRLGRSLLL